MAAIIVPENHQLHVCVKNVFIANFCGGKNSGFIPEKNQLDDEAFLFARVDSIIHVEESLDWVGEIQYCC